MADADVWAVLFHLCELDCAVRAHPRSEPELVVWVGSRRRPVPGPADTGPAPGVASVHWRPPAVADVMARAARLE